MHREERAVPLASPVESDYRKALSVLEVEVHELIASGWNEARRRRANEIASALHEASKAAGWRERTCVLQALRALLALPLRTIMPVRRSVRDRLLESLNVLLKAGESRTA